MSEPKGVTPGEWRYGTKRRAILRVAGIAQPCGYIPDDDDSYANARLMAQSKRMYEALEAVSLSGIEQEDPRLGYVVVQIDRRDWDEIRAVLAAARKEPDAQAG
jgi:hypothetical protein